MFSCKALLYSVLSETVTRSSISVFPCHSTGRKLLAPTTGEYAVAVAASPLQILLDHDLHVSWQFDDVVLAVYARKWNCH